MDSAVGDAADAVPSTGSAVRCYFDRCCGSSRELGNSRNSR